MLYKDLVSIKDTQFRRLVGVTRPVFEKMVSVVTDYKQGHRKHKTKGRPPKLTIYDQLLLMLMYFREYRTFFHVGSSFGISEGQAYRITIEMERILIQSKLFHLPGKKKLAEEGVEFEILIVDASESPIERPKKGQRKYYSGKKNGIQ